MMKTYEYYCPVCDVVFEKDFEFPNCDKSVGCPNCWAKSERYLGGGMIFILKGGGWVSKSLRLKSEMTARNERAARRQNLAWRDAVPKLVDQR
jgi:putative FmdB family regulatory protein